MALYSQYIVCGGGTAGTLVASRLSQAGKRVLLLEAGQKSPLWSRVPLGYLYSIGNSSVDWCYETTAQKGLNGRRLRYPRGKALGGCSVINGMIYMRGQSRDYDEWARLLDDSAWSWQQVLPYFKRHENFQAGPVEAEAEFHGHEGEWVVQKQRTGNFAVLEEFQAAAERCNIHRTDDFNTGSNEGCGLFHVNQRRGQRLTAEVFLKGADANFLQVEAGAQVAKLEFDDRRKCTGVRLVDGTVRHASAEVILCAGSIGSPALLEMSGIGSRARLEKLGIPVIRENDHVGEHMQDHLQMRHVFAVTGATTINSQTRSLPHLVKMGWDYLVHQRGPLSMAPSQLGAFTYTPGYQDGGFPNVQYHVQPLSLDAFGSPLHSFDGMTAAICNLRPTSRGSSHIQSRDCKVPPVIDPNYLSTDEDLRVAADSIRLTRQIMSKFSRFQPREVLPGLLEFPDSDTEKLRVAAGKIASE